MNVCNSLPSGMDEHKCHTGDDPGLQMLINTIRQGWPTKLHSVPAAMRPFHPYRHELVTDEGIVWKGHKVIISETLQLEYTQIVHRGQPGAKSTKWRAHGIFFWPIMSMVWDQSAGLQGDPCTTHKEKKSYEKTNKQLSTLSKGQVVRMQTPQG